LTGKAGLSCDNVLSAELVTADGQLLHVSAEENPDLFWAIRGGGGNFGVATSFEFRLHDVGPIIQLALLFWPLEQGEAALRLTQQAVDSLPADMGMMLACINAPPAPFVPEEQHFRPGYALVMVGFSSPEEHGRTVDPIRAALPPLFELITPMPYVDLQQMLDESAPWGILSYEKAHYLDGLSEDVIEVITTHVPRKNSPMTLVPGFPMRGAYCAIGDSDTAFGGPRGPGFVFNIAAVTPDPAVLVAERAWVREFWDALRPYASAASYVNFMSVFDNDRVKAAYGAEKYARLAKIKAAYDPDNVFHRGANIRPAN
jgi:FAD/FMN-containing dehydrogenase